KVTSSLYALASKAFADRPGMVRFLRIPLAMVCLAVLLVFGASWFRPAREQTWATVVHAAPGVKLIREGVSRPVREGDRLGNREIILNENPTGASGSPARRKVAH